MKKRLLNILLIGILIVGLTGCGNNTIDKTEKNNGSKTQNVDKNVKNGVISCVSPYGSETEKTVEDTTIENSVAIKHIITETNIYDNDEEYKKECEFNKAKESPQWEYYQNDKANCDDSTKTITHTRTYIKDENLTEIYNIKKFTNSDGSFNSKGYIEELEEYKYVCTIK